LQPFQKAVWKYRLRKRLKYAHTFHPVISALGVEPEEIETELRKHCLQMQKQNAIQRK
jgi:hypothetical protein